MVDIKALAGMMVEETEHRFLPEEIACDVHKISADHLTFEVQNLSVSSSSLY